MKNLLEHFSIFLVGILSMATLFFIVQYNLIEDDTDIDTMVLSSPEKSSKKLKASSYLDSLEGYGDDTDVEVDATKEGTVNRVAITSELKDDDLASVIEDKSKSSYNKNLENYSQSSNNLKVAKNPSGEPEKLAEEEIVDEIGMAIDALDL
ncbi:MAG: hypothetical protein Q9M36_04000 [Sulfurovum sp.]|nr:hypothetical protein [Sulfurovum sp.]